MFVFHHATYLSAIKFKLLTTESRQYTAQSDQDPAHLPGLWHKVCARLHTSCLQEVLLTLSSQMSKQGKVQELFSSVFHCGFQDAQQDATKYWISDKPWYPSWHCLVVKAEQADEQTALLHYCEPATSTNYIVMMSSAPRHSNAFCCTKNTITQKQIYYTA